MVHPKAMVTKASPFINCPEQEMYQTFTSVDFTVGLCHLSTV
jgi:hypothetical protein